LAEVSFDFLQGQYKQMKAKVDQASFDLMASLEMHRESSNDVYLFYSFFTQIERGFSIKELLFYLYVRSLAEKCLSLFLAKIPSSQDIRNIFLAKSKCSKIAVVFY